MPDVGKNKDIDPGLCQDESGSNKRDETVLPNNIFVIISKTMSFYGKYQRA